MRRFATWFGPCVSLAWAVWQIAALYFGWREWLRGDRVEAILGLCLPTFSLAMDLLVAAGARGISRWWALSATLGPIGIAMVYRNPALPLPVERFPAPPPEERPDAVAFATIVQCILVLHLVLTYPWDHRFAWVPNAVLYLCVSLIAMPSLSRTLMNRAYPTEWAAVALLGPIGLVIIACLPDRTVNPARGFPVEPTPES